MKEYNHLKIEKKWQADWQKNNLYKTKESTKEKCFVLDMFPYPSGEGLHVGHPRGYIATDVYSRMKKMQGFNILHPMGWDAFGLPAENYAIKNKIHPEQAVKKNIKRYKEQLSSLGFNYDWSREINTTDPEYYKWTQWIFLQLYKKGLAFESFEPINWCPSCQTGLANEDLEDGRCERCGSEIEKKPMRQWVLKITDYADRLLTDLETLDWPTSIKEAQKNWIGKSEGALIKFPLADNLQLASQNFIEVFTTRPDTIYGVTFMAVSPELAKEWLATGLKVDKSVSDFIAKTLKDRVKATFKTNPDKTGVFSGFYAINPASKEKVPIWITNYVLGEVGTGAIMAVPAHDERDFEFAKKYELGIKEVILPTRIDPNNPPAPGKKFVERQNVQAIVRDPKTNKFLLLKSKTYHWTTFPMGGVDNGEDIVEAGKREVAEETGFTNLKFIKVLGGQVRAEYFAKHKDQNRISYTNAVMFDLIDNTQIPLTGDDKDEHEILWLDKKDIIYPDIVHAELADWLTRWDKDNFVYTEAGVLINSDKFNGMTSSEAHIAITKLVGGKMISTYKLRDWVFSRQRYWGEPIPMIHCEKCALNNPTGRGLVPVPEKDLPVKLPEVKSYEPTGTGESPLAGIDKWVNVKCPICKGPAKRETNTMPQWAGSSWYYLRFMDPTNSKKLVDPKKEKYWSGSSLPHHGFSEGGVNMYVGGSEHATRHLIYARFWHKFLYDIGAVTTSEPFKRIGKNLGLILGEDGRKMSKRWGNVVNPDEVVKIYGADTLRVYEMFMGPFNQEIAWDTKSMIGSRRFLEKVWRLQTKVSKEKTSEDISVILNQTIKKVGEDIESFNFNTAISSLMILVNALEKLVNLNNQDYQTLLKLLHPFAPHLSEELWQTLGFSTKSIYLSPWPVFDPSKLTSEEVKVVVQVGGKVRGVVVVAVNASEQEVLAKVKQEANLAKYVDLEQIKKVVFIPNKIINLVV